MKNNETFLKAISAFLKEITAEENNKRIMDEEIIQSIQHLKARINTTRTNATR